MLTRSNQLLTFDVVLMSVTREAIHRFMLVDDAMVEFPHSFMQVDDENKRHKD